MTKRSTFHTHLNPLRSLLHLRTLDLPSTKFLMRSLHVSSVEVCRGGRDRRGDIGAGRKRLGFGLIEFSPFSFSFLILFLSIFFLVSFSWYLFLGIFFLVFSIYFLPPPFF